MAPESSINQTSDAGSRGAGMAHADASLRLARLSWLGRRLLAMSPGEISARAQRTVAHRYDDLVWRVPPLWQRRWRSPSTAIAIGASPRGYLTAERARWLAKNDAAEAARVVEQADQMMAGRVKFFGYPEVQLSRPVDYSYDPHADVRWPAAHTKRIDYRHVAKGDPKWIWELNRLQRIPLVVEAWLLTQDERYAEYALREIDVWRARNPPGRGIAWSNGYEAGLRAISLATALDALRPMAARDPEPALRILGLLWQHARWIERDPSTHSSANNHRVGELVGLVVISLLVPEVPGSQRRLPGALALLLDHLDEQVLSDGTGAERAIYYHLHVVDLALITAATLQATGQAIPKRLQQVLQRSADGLSVQTGEDEPPLRYGDEDDASAIRLDSGDRRTVETVASALAAFLGHGGARRVAHRLSPTAWWLFGDAGRQRFEETPPSSRPGSVFLHDAGLTLLRRGGTRLSFDAGKLGFGSLSAHGHADALAVTFARGSCDLVTDPGTGSYFRESKIRNAFRGTGFHGTVLVDGVDQSKIGGAFLWTRHAKAWPSFVDPEAGIVVGEHDGYRVLPDPVRHRRAVVLLESGDAVVYDRLDAREVHTYHVRWPLDPALEAAEEEGCVRGTVNGVAQLSIASAASVPLEVRLVRGAEDPFEGWWSRRLESYEPAWLVSFEARATGRIDIVTLLSADPAAVPAQLAPTEDGARLEFSSRGEQYVMVVSLADLRPVTFEEPKTAAPTAED